MVPPSSDVGRDEFPPIWVSDSGYDDMGEILDELGFSYDGLGSVNLDTLDEGVVLLNCHVKWKADNQEFDRVVTGLERFVGDGGSALGSDFAAELLQAVTDTTFDQGTSSKTIEARVVDDELSDILGQERIELEFDLGGWYKPATVPPESNVLLEDESGDTIAFQYSFGDGDIVYTAFHNHAQASEVEKALLELLVMKPVAAEMDMGLKEATKITKSESVIESGGDSEPAEETDAEPTETLAITAIPDEDTVPAGEPLKVRVRDETGELVFGATVSHEDGAATTDDRGNCTVTFPSPGEYELSVDKEDADVDYDVQPVTITVTES